MKHFKAQYDDLECNPSKITIAPTTTNYWAKVNLFSEYLNCLILYVFETNISPCFFSCHAIFSIVLPDLAKKYNGPALFYT